MAKRARGGGVEQRVVDAIVAQCTAALGGDLLVAHADPHVGVHGTRALDGLVGVSCRVSRPVAPGASERSSSSE